MLYLIIHPNLYLNPIQIQIQKKKSNVSFNNDSSNQEMEEEEEASFFDAVSNHPSDPDMNPDPDTNPDTDPGTNPGVGDNVDDNSSPNSGVNDNGPTGLDNSFNPDGYWGINAHSTCEYVLNTIASFTKFEASKSTPQYGFNRGMEEFGELGFEATIKEVWCDALSYLMFLKRKRDGSVKARGCADGRPQREYISKDDSSSPTVSIYNIHTNGLVSNGRYR
jgi:hypothetical protein